MGDLACTSYTVKRCLCIISRFVEVVVVVVVVVGGGGGEFITVNVILNTYQEIFVRGKLLICQW